MDQLSAIDAGFLYTESARTPMHVTALQIYDPSTAQHGRVELAQVIENVQQRAAQIDCYHRKLLEVPWRLDHPYWINDNEFDPSQHVFEYRLPEPGGWAALCGAVSELHARPLPRTKPLWEMHFIPDLGDIDGVPAGAYAIVTKIHHAAVDGVAGISVTAALHDLQPERAVTNAAEVPRESPPAQLDLLRRTALTEATRPFKTLRALPALSRLSATRMTAPLPPRTRFNGRVSGQRIFDALHVPLDALRAIKRQVPGATVNDVILTIVGGGLRAYLRAHGELPKRPMTAMVPVNTRKELVQSQEGNQVSQMLVTLGTDVEDPVERLRTIYRASTAAKLAEQNLDGSSTGALAELAEIPPAPWLSFLAQGSSYLANSPLFSTVVTNVKAPAVPMYSCGAKLVRAYGTGPVVDGAAVFHTALSYCGELNLSVMSCAKTLPDVEFYVGCLQATFDELNAATQPCRSDA